MMQRDVKETLLGTAKPIWESRGNCVHCAGFLVGRFCWPPQPFVSVENKRQRHHRRRGRRHQHKHLEMCNGRGTADDGHSEGGPKGADLKGIDLAMETIILVKCRHDFSLEAFEQDWSVITVAIRR